MCNRVIELDRRQAEAGPTIDLDRFDRPTRWSKNRRRRVAKGQVRSTKEKRKPKKEKPKPGSSVFGETKGKDSSRS